MISQEYHSEQRFEYKYFRILTTAQNWISSLHSCQRLRFRFTLYQLMYKNTFKGNNSSLWWKLRDHDLMTKPRGGACKCSVGKNRTKFRRTKHRAEILTVLSDFYLTFVLKYWTKFSTDKMFRRTKFSTPSWNFDTFVWQILSEKVCKCKLKMQPLFQGWFCEQIMCI